MLDVNNFLLPLGLTIKLFYRDESKVMTSYFNLFPLCLLKIRLLSFKVFFIFLCYLPKPLSLYKYDLDMCHRIFLNKFILSGV